MNIGRIGVIGPGIVGAPMAALLARAAKRGHYGPEAHVMVVQRDSPTSGWKVPAINEGRSPIGGIEPGLDEIVGDTSGSGHLRASHDYGELAKADVVLVCVQTDKDGLGPDYGPMMSALDTLGRNLEKGRGTLVVIESTLAPSSMFTVISERLAGHGLHEGKDVFLGNSPNRVMPGRLVERIAHADKLAGGLDPRTPARIAELYAPIVNVGTVHQTNSLTAEVVKTLENTWRDVRIAYAAELVQQCDADGVDFFALRDAVNEHVGRGDAASGDAAVVPTGALLVPMLGVGGHCLPKDGILMRWRYNQTHPDAPKTSLIHVSREINDDAPGASLRMAEAKFGAVDGKKVALLGLAYRADSDDTRNSPTFQLAKLLEAKGCEVVVHDPYVRPTDDNLRKSGLTLTKDLDDALSGAVVAFVCQAHKPYRDGGAALLAGRGLRGVHDACNYGSAEDFEGAGVPYTGVGRGTRAADEAFVRAAYAGYQAVALTFARELQTVVEDLNARYASSDFQKVDLAEVLRLAATCATGCDIPEPGPSPEVPGSIRSRLVELSR